MIGATARAGGNLLRAHREEAEDVVHRVEAEIARHAEEEDDAMTAHHGAGEDSMTVHREKGATMIEEVDTMTDAVGTMTGEGAHHAEVVGTTITMTGEGAHHA